MLMEIGGNFCCWWTTDVHDPVGYIYCNVNKVSPVLHFSSLSFLLGIVCVCVRHGALVYLRRRLPVIPSCRL